MDFNNIGLDPRKLLNFSRLSNRELLKTEASLNYHDLELDAIICSRAGLEIEWANADSETFEGVLDRAIEILKEGI